MTISASHTFESKNIFFFNLSSFSSSPKTSQNHHLLCRNRMRLWFHRHGMFPKHDFQLVATNLARVVKITVAIAPVMAKTKSKCASGLKIIQFFLIFENKSKIFFRFEKKKQKNEKNGKNRNKTKKHRKNEQKTRKKREKQRKNWRFFVIFGFDYQIWFKNEKTDKNRKQKRKKKQTQKRQQIENTSKKERKLFFATNSRFCLM